MYKGYECSILARDFKFIGALLLGMVYVVFEGGMHFKYPIPTKTILVLNFKTNGHIFIYFNFSFTF